jgi:hypothetical protein
MPSLHRLGYRAHLPTIGGSAKTVVMSSRNWGSLAFTTTI